MAIDTIFAPAASKGRENLKAIALRAWNAVRAWYIKRQTRYHLLELTDEQLRDIGVSRGEARREVSKSFYWDVNA